MAEKWAGIGGTGIGIEIAMRVFIQTIDGCNNGTFNYAEHTKIDTVIEEIRRVGGFMTLDDGERAEIFVPWHRIDFIREEKD